jgi:hypothetical protein
MHEHEPQGTKPPTQPPTDESEGRSTCLFSALDSIGSYKSAVSRYVIRPPAHRDGQREATMSTLRKFDEAAHRQQFDDEQQNGRQQTTRVSASEE